MDEEVPADPPAPEGAPRSAPRRRRRLLALLALPLLATLALRLGLGVHEAALAPGYAGPRPLAPEVAARFAYPEQGQPAPELTSFDRAAGWGYEDQRCVQLLVTAPSDPEPHKVQILHFRPDPDRFPGRRPAVVITPTLGGSNEIGKLLAAALARRGLHGAVVLRAERVLDHAYDEARLERVLRTAVVDRRRAIDWLAERKDVDPAAIGAFGVSLGGIAATLVAAVEPRVRATVIVLGGGGLGGMIIGSDERRVQRYVRGRGLPPHELRQRIDAAVVSDPLALAPSVDARRVLFVQARWDRTVPTAHQEQLWQALGRPRRLLLPAGHYTAAVYLPYVLAETLAFFEEELGPGR